jgi:hypothetical protein
MLLTVTLAWVLTADVQLRDRATIERELDEVSAASPKAWIYGPLGGLTGAGALATVVGLFSNFHCGGSFFSFYGSPTYSCNAGSPAPWGQAAIGLGVVSMIAGVVGMLVLTGARMPYVQRKRTLQDELDLVNVHEELRAEREEQRREEARVERRRSHPEVSRAYDALDAERVSYAPAIGLMVPGGLALLASLLIAIHLPDAAQGNSLVPALGAAIALFAAGATVEGLGLWHLSKRRAANRAIDEKQQDLELGPQPVPSPEHEPLSPSNESRLPAAPLLLGWSFAL